MALQTGQVLNGRYRIVKLLGEGGFGAVYRAWDITFSIPCALKENREISPQAQRQFQREAKILHTLRHPNLPLVKDYFTVPGQGQYLVMDFVEGDDLQQLLDRKGSPFLENQVITWLSEICAAVKYLHIQEPPVIHRDIKPANIKIRPDGKAMLVDFGLFKLYDPDLPTTLGARAVTPGYAPFEQYGHAPTDERTDIYALGATAYTLLTAKVPSESIMRVTGTELPKIRKINPNVSEHIENVIHNAMMVMPDDRYPSVDAFREALIGSKDVILQKIESGMVADALIEPAVSTLPVSSPELVAHQEPVAMLRQDDVEKATGAVSASDSKRALVKRLGLLGIILVTVIALGIFVYLQFSPGYDDTYNPDDEHLSASGAWAGGIEMMEWQPAREAMLFLESEPDSRYFFGELIVIHPDGNEEHRGIEGEVVLPVGDITFVDSAGWHYWGWYEENIFGGELSLDCLHCDVHGGFEFHRE